MSTITDEALASLNAAAWVGKTLSVALAYDPTGNWDRTFGYDDIAGMLIAPGTVGTAWQEIEPQAEDFTTTDAGIGSSRFPVTFTRNGSATALNVTHAVVLEPIAGPSWRLVSWQPIAGGSAVEVPAGQIVEVSVTLGHGR